MSTLVPAEPSSTSEANLRSIAFTDFEPTYAIILVLSFLVLIILIILLCEISFPKFWHGMVNAPLFKKR